MKLEILTICEFAANYNGKLCITGISDLFYSAKEPAKLQKCYLVYRVRYDPSEAGVHSLKVSVVDQDGKPVVPPLADKKTIQLREGSPGCIDTGIICLNGIPLPSFGEYSVELVVDDTPLASQPLYLLRAQ
jgi:hypothetical protein